MIDKIKDKINNNVGFIACFDQLKLLDEIYFEVFEESKKHLYVKITSKDDDFTDTEIWKNKFVFYSPKIIYGNDFVPDSKTDIFVFSKGGSIDSLQIVQQATRCRVIKDLYYYIKVKPLFLKYKDVNECRNIINQEKKTHYNILKELNCIEYDEEAKTNIKINVYSDMFLYNEMVDDLLKSNYLYHFEAIITKKGFNIIDLQQEHIPVSKEIRNNAKNELEKITEIMKDLYMKRTLKYTYPLFSETANNRAKILKIKDDRNEERKYLDIIIENNKFKEHLATSKLFRSLKANNDDYKGEMPEQQIKTLNNKLLLIEYIEKIINIDRFDFNSENKDTKYNEWNKAYFNKYVSTIRNYKCKYDNSYNELFKIRLSLYKSINKNIFIKTRNGGGKREYTYSINEEEIKHHLDLFLMRQSNRMVNVNEIVIKKYNIDVDGFVDDDMEIL
jgi:hypothetical protein